MVLAAMTSLFFVLVFKCNELFNKCPVRGRYPVARCYVPCCVYSTEYKFLTHLTLIDYLHLYLNLWVKYIQHQNVLMCVNFFNDLKCILKHTLLLVKIGKYTPYLLGFLQMCIYHSISHPMLV